MRRTRWDQVRAGTNRNKIVAGHGTLEFTDEELEAVTYEFHRHGLSLAAHAACNDAIHGIAQFG